MSFAFPLGMILAVLAIPIIGFYILKVRLRRIPVSTNLFWKQIFDEKPPRSIWQHFRHLLSLLLQLLMLSLLVFSIADPYFPWQLLHARRIVIVVDNSASMRATDVKPSRFEAARQAARQLIEGLRFRDEVAIVLAGAQPQVVVGMTGHIPTLRRAIESIPRSDLPTVLRPAIELGEQLVGDHPHGQVVVLTDGCIEKADISIEETDANSHAIETRVSFRTFATDAANIGITQLQVRRSLIDPLGYEVLATVTNASAAAVKCRLELTLDDIPIDVLPLDLKPEEVWSRSLEKTSLTGGRIAASLTQIRASESDRTDQTGSNGQLDPRDPANLLNQLAVDDAAWAILPSRKVQKVMIVTPGNLFLQKVFEANPLVQIQLRKDLPDPWPADSIVVLHGQVPDQLPAGNLLVIDPSRGCDHWDLGEVLENPIITEQDKNSPLMTHLRLDNVMLPESKQILFKAAPQILAGTISGDPVYAEVRRLNGKCLVLSVNLERSDLAFRTVFPIMVTNALNWFAGKTGELLESQTTGVIASVPIHIKELLSDQEFDVVSPSNNQTSLSTGESIGPFNEVGVWSIVVRGMNARDGERIKDSKDAKQVKDKMGPTENDSEVMSEIAVNLSNARESDLRSAIEISDSSSTAMLAANWLSRPLWFYLIAAACVLTAIEWFMYQRRVIT